MAQIGQYQLGSFASPVNGGALDANVVRGNDNSIVGVHDNHDNDPTIHVQSFPFASLPSASTLGRFLIANDTYRAYFDTGSVLQEIAYLSKAGGAITGNLTVSGTVTAAQQIGVVSSASTASLQVSSVGGSGRDYRIQSTTAGAWNIRDASASADRLTIAAGGATSILAALTVSGALLPSATATFDLGSTGTRWNSLFLAAGVVMGGSISGATTGAFSGTVTAGSFSGPLTGDVLGALTVATSTSAPGKIYKTAANGLVLQAVTGSSNDLILTGPSNTLIARVPTGTVNTEWQGNLTTLGTAIVTKLRGGSSAPTPTKFSGAATFTAAASSGSNDTAGQIVMTVTAPGTWTLKVAYTSSYLAIPYPVIVPSLGTAGTGQLIPANTSVLNEAVDAFYVSGAAFSSTGTYYLNYNVIG